MRAVPIGASKLADTTIPEYFKKLYSNTRVTYN